MKRCSFSFGFILWLTLHAWGQPLRPGFDRAEYRTLMLLSTRVAGEAYAKDFEAPVPYQRAYQSPVMGLENQWELWTSPTRVAVVSIRGTTEEPVSWLANFYAAMVPAKGRLQIAQGDTFAYHLASHPQAAVHAGWLLATAFLARDVQPRIDSLYAEGYRDVLIVGHSQGGAIAYLLTAHLRQLQRTGAFPAEVRLKTYCSAGPKPGNLFFAYEYEAAVQPGWGFNVVNAADWVPEMPLSVQTFDDFNVTNPLKNARQAIGQRDFKARTALTYAYNQMDKPTRKAQANYQRFLGKTTSRMITDNLPGFVPPTYYTSSHYVRTGPTVVLMPDSAYYQRFPDNDSTLFVHHLHQPYLYLLERLPIEIPVLGSTD